MTSLLHQSTVTSPPAAGVALPELADDVCMSGTSSDPSVTSVSHVERILAAAGVVESLEWELDRAQGTLTEAIEQAASGGCSLDTIAESAGMPKEDVASLLWGTRMDLPPIQN